MAYIWLTGIYLSRVFICSQTHQYMDTTEPSLIHCTDSLASLHQRMDRFYAWASQLQVEHRDLKQRVGYLEDLVIEAGCNASGGVDGMSLGPI